jgi:hypothetical protein
MVGEVYGLSVIVCHLSNFKIDRLGQEFCYLSMSHFFLSLILACQHGILNALNV